MFVFGSSVVDNGNNNYLPNSAMASYSPYGVDFPTGPTGRFSNGENVADLIGGLLNLPDLPAFLDPSTTANRTLHGVNYGSGGAGILDDTGFIAGLATINLNPQISNFEKVTLPQLERQLNCSDMQILCHYLFVIAVGGNDYQLNYFVSNSSNAFSLETFTNMVMAAYSERLKRLYNIGARKFVLININPIGCGPAFRANASINGCQENLNAAARLFNERLIPLIDALKENLSSSHFVVVKAYNIISAIIHNPNSEGFSNVTGSCCELSMDGVLCERNGNVCPNRSSFAYFDGQHSTSKVSYIIALKAFDSTNISEDRKLEVGKVRSPSSLGFRGISEHQVNHFYPYHSKKGKKKIAASGLRERVTKRRERERGNLILGYAGKNTKMSLACLVCHRVESPSHSFRSYSISSSENEGKGSAMAGCLSRISSSIPPSRGTSSIVSSSKVTPQPTISNNEGITGTPRLVRSRAIRRDHVRNWNFDEVDLEH
ncbi:hypothetical protein Nepgr_002146 [Nepenthes gracilis]|uniref:GDSL esterase/lipase n=1 Tax=Nepenthes gracilis TaxID=150966 RepID=A0AAD3P9M1_NEPGR|nr:hypothetical protein Nepgr_002146 [Nepenthes gracilis]